MKRKLIITLCMVLTILIGSISAVKAAPPYKSYTYSTVVGYTWAAPSPVPYIPVGVIDSRSLGVDLKQPEDIFRDKNDNYYIADAGTNSIIITDKNWKLIKVIKNFQNGDKLETLNKPNGVYVTDDGHLYIADTENGRIVELDSNGELVRILGKPESDVLGGDFKYFPRKLILDNANRFFIVARGVYEGIMELDYDGLFTGFVGSNKVTFSAADMFWKRLYTKEQRNKMIQFIPIEYNNFCLDESGFMYAVTATDSNNKPIKKLNPSGKDVLRRSGLVKTVNGDLVTTAVGVSITGVSNFIDVCVDEYGVYNALDSKRGRIFAYDSDGNLLYVFGNINTNQVGTFKNPTAIERVGDNLIVADGGLGRITIFEMTEYAKLIRLGVTQYSNGEYIESIDTWNNVLKYNANYDLAYVQIGKTLLRQGYTKDSLEYFKLARYRGSVDTGYSKAFTEYRKDFLRNNFAIIATAIVILVILLVVLKKYKKKREAANKPGIVVLEGGEGA